MIDTDKFDARTEGLKVTTKALKEMSKEEREEWMQKMWTLLPNIGGEEE